VTEESALVCECREARLRKRGFRLRSPTFGGRVGGQATPAGVDSGRYDAQDLLLAYGNATYSYTSDGDLRFKVNGTDTTKYTYDAFGSLVSVTLPNGTLIEYLLDGNGLRVGRKVNGAITQKWIYSNNLRIVAETDSANQVTSRFVYTTSENVPEYMVKAGVVYRIVTDHLGSVKQVVNTQTGDVVQQAEYDEFGNILLDTNPGFVPFGFAGGLHDHTTKLIRFGARDYDPHIRRWICKDPVSFSGGSYNLYSYVGNDPINSLDPKGLQLTERGRVLLSAQLQKDLRMMYERARKQAIKEVIREGAQHATHVPIPSEVRTGTSLFTWLGRLGNVFGFMLTSPTEMGTKDVQRPNVESEEPEFGPYSYGLAPADATWVMIYRK